MESNNKESELVKVIRAIAILTLIGGIVGAIAIGNYVHGAEVMAVVMAACGIIMSVLIAGFAKLVDAAEIYIHKNSSVEKSSVRSTVETRKEIDEWLNENN